MFKMTEIEHTYLYVHVACEKTVMITQTCDTVARTELAFNSVCHINKNNALCMTHSTANSTHYGNVWLHTFNSARLVPSV